MPSQKNLTGNFGQRDFFDKVWFQLWPILAGKGWKFSKIFSTKSFIDPWPIDGPITIFLKNQSLVLQIAKFFGLKLVKFWYFFGHAPHGPMLAPNPKVFGSHWSPDGVVSKTGPYQNCYPRSGAGLVWITHIYALNHFSSSYLFKKVAVAGNWTRVCRSRPKHYTIWAILVAWKDKC